MLIPFSLHHALTLMPLLWQSRIRCCQSCIDTLALISVIAGVISFMADSLIGVPFTLFECLEYLSLVYFTIFSQPFLDVGYLVGTFMFLPTQKIHKSNHIITC